LGLTIGLIAILLNYSVVPQVIVILSLAFLLAVFGITSLMIQQISRMTESNSGEKTLEKAKPVQFGAVNTAQLEEYRQPAMSITETTTRTLDKELVK
jgi:Tfp pilus assembly protein PilO